MVLILWLVGCFDVATTPAVARTVPAPTRVDTGSDPLPDTGVAEE